jgi:hypothetical protein
MLAPLCKGSAAAKCMDCGVASNIKNPAALKAVPGDLVV